MIRPLPGVTVVALLATSMFIAGSSAASSCEPVDLLVPAPYAVTGYFMYPRARDCGWRDELKRVHQLGGDTVVQLAPQLSHRSIDAQGRVLRFDGTEPDPNFTACMDGDKTCYRAADAALRALNPGNRIVETYAYATADAFTDQLMTCARTEKKIAVPVNENGVQRTRLYWRLFLPRAAPEQTGCSTVAAQYDLVLIAGDRANSLGTLLAEADAYRMRVYAPMPAFPSTDGRNSNVDKPRMPAFTAFDRRVLADYARQYAGHPSFAGVYQTREYLLDTPYADYLAAYRDQHTDVRRLLPGKRVLASPYWSSRRYAKPTGDTLNPKATTPADVNAAVTQLYQVGVDVVAPQDGRGSGTAGLFWPYESNHPVDPRLVSKTGDRTYGEAFIATSTRLYQAAAEARNAMLDSGRNVELWANVEAFEPDGTTLCAGFLHRTDKARVDQALTHLGNHVSKVISFQWDPLYTCDDGGSPLADQIRADHDRPLVSHGFRWTSDGRPGIVLDGYHLDAATVKLTWYDAAWQMHSRTVTVAESGWYDPSAGRNSPRLPDPMQAIWVPFAWTDMAPHFFVHADVTSAGEPANHRYSLAY